MCSILQWGEVIVTKRLRWVVFALAWLSIFFAPEAASILGLSRGAFFWVGFALFVAAGLMYVPSLLGFLGRLSDREKDR